MRSACWYLFGGLRLLGLGDFLCFHPHPKTFFFRFNRRQALGYFFPRAFPNWWSDLCAIHHHYLSLLISALMRPLLPAPLTCRWSTISYGRPWTHWTNDVRVKNTEKAS